MDNAARFTSPSSSSWAFQLAFSDGKLHKLVTPMERARRAINLFIRLSRESQVKNQTSAIFA